LSSLLIVLRRVISYNNKAKTGILEARERAMPDLKTAISLVEVIVVIIVAMALGDYLGYKIGRWRLAAILGALTLTTIVAFAIYAAVVLA
jgi:hypothetical protein